VGSSRCDAVKQEAVVIQRRGHQSREAGSLERLEKARGLPGGKHPCKHLDWNTMRFIWDFQAPELQKNKPH
jgi:hypothetical protein